MEYIIGSKKLKKIIHKVIGPLKQVESEHGSTWIDIENNVILTYMNRAVGFNEDSFDTILDILNVNSWREEEKKHFGELFQEIVSEIIGNNDFVEIFML